jgi:uncharacterized membrane protein YhhN
VTTAAWCFLVAFFVVAPLDWWSRWRDLRRLELVTKPLATALLIAVALTLSPDVPAARVWFAIALVLSLVGDVMLLDDGRFVAGLVAFLLAHVAYGAGFLALDTWRWWTFALSAVPIALALSTVGVRIVRATRSQPAVLQIGVRAYLVVILAMFALACGAGSWVLVLGAALFVLSDSLLGWRTFVATDASRATATAVMVTYHAAQCLLTLALVG